MKKPKRILIIRTDRIGDVVLSTPLIEETRKAFPNAFIGVMVAENTKEILFNNPNIDEIIIYSKNSSLWDEVKKIKKYKFDTALLLLSTERLAWILFFAGIPKRITVGWKPYQALTFMKLVSRNKYIPLRHEADYCLDLGRKIGITNIKDIAPKIYLTQSEIEQAKILIPEDDSLWIGINPASGNSSPNWSIQDYLKLTKVIISKTVKTKVIINLDRCEKYENEFRQISSDRIILLIQVPIRKLILYISRMNVMISSSTGPMHIASALKIPTISLFCPLPACSTKLWGPLGNLNYSILPPDNYCKTRCPGDPHICTFQDGIMVDDVLKILNDHFLKN